ncbi:MAG: holo-ACP synthase [Candidatus Aminicenantes bacterium]|nr:holo-ACP synthase [Candidatus Aminicenantes bacterium]
MIVGVGIDLIEVERVKKALDEHPRFSDRVFTPEEVRYSSGKKNTAQHLAARFAAKEAFFKALGRRIPWTDVGVVNLDSGRPVLEVKNAEGLGFLKAHVSLSHLKAYAQAAVVLEK